MNIPNPFAAFARKKMLYTLVFKTLDGMKVLQDLASYCYLDSTTFDRDPQVTARNEGRRQVILYILQALNMDINELGDHAYGNQSDRYSVHATSGSIHAEQPGG